MLLHLHRIQEHNTRTLHKGYIDMALKRKAEIEQVINKGGQVKADKEKHWVNFTLRIREDLLVEIERQLEETIGISKTGWILQAIQEKLKKKE